MADHATPNLPARDFEQTSRFYGALGFTESWRDRSWMILRRGSLTLEFFADPDFDADSSSFGSCLRLDDMADFYAVCQKAGIPEQHSGRPRLSPPRREPSGLDIAYMIDPDGSLIRLIQNPAD